MKNKAYTLIELLSVIIILAVVCSIAIPRIIDVVGVSKIVAYDTSKKNIIKSAKLKYIADVNSAEVIEYTVDDLISDGYLKKDIKNPITDEDYKNTKVLITNKDGDLNFSYIEGNTLYDVVTILDDKDGLYKEGNNYIYKGINSNNFVSFNGDIYRILKIDSYRNVYLIKEEIKKEIKKGNVSEYIKSYYNDNFLEKIKEDIVSLDALNYNDYYNSFINNETYIVNNNDIWIKDHKDYKVLSNLTNEITDKESANIRLVLKLKSSITVESGNGTQLRPYIIEK